MKLNKVFKYLFVVVLVLLIGKLILPEIFDNRPFKFEKYKTDEQLEEAIKRRFPVGSDFNYAVSMFEKSSSECRLYKPSNRLIDIGLACTYSTKIISLHPLEWYEVGIDGNKDGEIVDVRARRISGLILISL